MSELVTWLRQQLDDDERANQRTLCSKRLAATVTQTGLVADIAAKRAILDLLDVTEERSIPVDAWVLAKATIRHLATAYADRDGYREEWRP